MKTAKSIIERDINNFAFYFAENGADAGLHVVIGKIGLAVELDLITYDEMDRYIEQVFYAHSLI